MTGFPLHAAETAPEASRDRLKAIESKTAFVPNLFGRGAGGPGSLSHAFR